MPDLVIFVALVGLIGAAGIALGMLAARRLAVWDERRAAAETAARDAVRPARGSGSPARGSGSARDIDPLEDGGDTVD
jgi:hypothetical protein